MATFGKTAIGGTAVADLGINYQSSFGPYTLPVAGTITGMWVYLEGGASGTTDIELQIWADSSGSPGALKARSAPRTFTGPFSAGWQRFVFPAGITLPAASYHFGWHVGGSALMKFYYDSSSGNRHYKANAYSNDPIDPYPSPDGNDAIAASIYADYTATVIPTDTTRRAPSRRIRGLGKRVYKTANRGLARRVTSGVIVADDFASLANWTNEGSWSVDATRPCYIAYPTPTVLLAGGAVGSVDGSGPREAHLIAMPDKSDGTKGRWYLFYDAGDGNSSGANSPWQAKLAYSDDRGLTWTKLGNVGGLTNGSYPSQCMGGFVFLHSDGQWYIYVLEATAESGGIPGGNYVSAIYKAPWVESSFTFIRESPALGGSGAFDEQCDVIGWVEKDSGGTWHAYYSARTASTSADPGWNVGHATASDPGGPWTKDGAGGFTATAVTKKADGSRPENPKKWYSRFLGKHVITANVIDSLASPSGADAWYSDSTSDFQASTVYRRRLQQLVPLDGDQVTAPAAHGIPVPICDPFGRALEDEYGRVGFVFDGAPSGFGGNPALGRKILSGTFEPAKQAAKYTAPDATSRHLARAVTHADFVAEWDWELAAASTSNLIAFAYRRSASSADDAGNGYAFVWDLSGTLYLKKLTGGSYSNLTSTGFTAPPDTFLNDIDTRNHIGLRIRVVVVGGLHRLYIDGTLKLGFYDATYTSGAAVTFWGQATHWIRNFHMRTSQNIVVTDCPPGATVALRTAGGLPVLATTADMFGVAAFSPTHSPASEIDVAGRSCPVPEGIYGGDTFQFVA